jgi:hemerythrin-like domain-containing protein
MKGKSTSLPGFDAPALSFEQPFDMLVACHERVTRTLDLLRRLIDHIDARGHDGSSRSAAADVMRYFDIAAPLHHEDEELHVFPALSGHPDAQLRSVLARLQADHEHMTVLWTQLRGALVVWRDEAAPPAITQATRQAASDFIGLYAGHIAAEEGLVYPAARCCFDAQGLARIGNEVQARRLK